MPDLWESGFGITVIAFCLLALLFWFPNDIGSGFIGYSPAGKPEPGDAFFPILLAAAMLVLGMVQLLKSLSPRGAGRERTAMGRIGPSNLRFLALFVALFSAAIAIMAWLGPLTVSVLARAGLLEQSYRQLSSTFPYKYIGYVGGGFALPFTLMVWIEGRPQWRQAWVIAALLLALILIFDVLLRNVQIPPNADL